MPLGRVGRFSSSFKEFSCAREFTGGNHSQMLDVLAEQGSEFGQDQPRVGILSVPREGTHMPDSVFQPTGRHRSTGVLAK